MKRRGFEPQDTAASIAHIHIQIYKIHSAKNCHLVQNGRERAERKTDSREKDRQPREKQKETKEKNTQSAATATAKYTEMKLHRPQPNDRETITLLACPISI